MDMLGRRVGLGLAARGDVRDTVEYALQAERLGFESVWIHDSYFERDPVTYLATIGREVRTIRVCAGAMNPYTRHPVVLAMTGSALDDLAPGRFTMALGSGLPLRLAQMNIPFDDTVAEVSRAIDLLRTLWAGERLVLNPNVPPLQPMFAPPHRIPLYIAGYQGRFLDLCCEKADGYLARPAESIPALRLMQQRIHRSAHSHGRSPDGIEVAGYVLSLARTQELDARIVSASGSAYAWHQVVETTGGTWTDGPPEGDPPNFRPPPADYRGRWPAPRPKGRSHIRTYAWARVAIRARAAWCACSSLPRCWPASASATGRSRCAP